MAHVFAHTVYPGSQEGNGEARRQPWRHGQQRESRPQRVCPKSHPAGAEEGRL